MAEVDKMFDPLPANVVILDQSAKPLFLVRIDDAGKLVAEYDPADLDEAARKLLDAMVGAYVVPDKVARLVAEVDRLRSDLEAPGSAWAQRAEALAEVARLREALVKARELNNQMANTLDHDELNNLGRSLDDVITAAIGEPEAATP